MTNVKKEKLEDDLKVKREVCFALVPNTFRLAISHRTANSIRKSLKELYSGDDDQLH